ncbi:hypothetical protein OHA70_06820 [Kribbella sp. NBC_00382]|uniref:hypothetical protein n=1 Tax=Kribbella sp. NBC_00382 TaxID=2975967 RepID=UPI002E1A20B4
MRAKRFWPAIGLFFLSPLVAEYLLGNLPITALYAVIGLACLYGGGAVLSRELVRRRGWGYPSLVVLALAYGIFEEGVTTQSLFNPNYVDQRLLDPGYIHFLGMGAPWTLFVLTLHTVWSITVPIVLVEAVSKRPREPWLGKIGLWVVGMFFLAGVVASTAIQLNNDPFVASPWQFAGVAVALVALIGVAARLGRQAVGGRPARLAGSVPAVWLVGVSALLVTSGFMLVSDLDVPGWWAAGIYLVGWVASVRVVVFWGRHELWSRRHVLALATGALLTYAWHGFPETPVLEASKAADLVGNGIFAALALVLLVVAWRRVGVFTPAGEMAATGAMADATIRRDKFGDS